MTRDGRPQHPGPAPVDTDHPSPPSPLILWEISRSTLAIVLALSGSPSRASRTAILAGRTTAELRARGHQTHVLALRDLPAAPLLAADIHDPAPTPAESTTPAPTSTGGRTPTDGTAGARLHLYADLQPAGTRSADLRRLGHRSPGSAG
ncbi:NADPH-dependent FMN reductase [Streptomyces sp. DH7]|uniref:NADPH-dependent FMN reductase n=1 Tax=Streptomyces sp. DH7 TaxID=2857006 RepID=UPI0035B002B0